MENNCVCKDKINKVYYTLLAILALASVVFISIDVKQSNNIEKLNTRVEIVEKCVSLDIDKKIGR